MSGSFGSTSPPTHEITTRAVNDSPSSETSVQTPAASSKRASVISVPVRRCARSCHLSTTPRRYCQISSDGE